MAIRKDKGMCHEQIRNGTFGNCGTLKQGIAGGSQKSATSNEAVTELARSKGYDVTVDEMIDYVAAKKATLSKEDLDKVAAGKSSAQHTQVRAQHLVFSGQEATVFTTIGTEVEVEVVIVAT